MATRPWVRDYRFRIAQQVLQRFILASESIFPQVHASQAGLRLAWGRRLCGDGLYLANNHLFYQFFWKNRKNLAAIFHHPRHFGPAGHGKWRQALGLDTPTPARECYFIQQRIARQNRYA